MKKETCEHDYELKGEYVVGEQHRETWKCKKCGYVLNYEVTYPDQPIQSLEVE